MEAKPLISLLKRMAKCKYSTVVMTNRMFLQSYDIGIDSTIGLNYVLYIPDTDAYQDSFYDETLILNQKILKEYALEHKRVDAIRKEKKLNPKQLHEEFHLIKENGRAALKFSYILDDVPYSTVTCDLGMYPVDLYDSMVENVVNSYQSLLKRIKMNGIGFVQDGMLYNLTKAATDTRGVVFHIIRYDNGTKRIRVPIIKSMLSMDKPDRFLISVQETELDGIFVYSLQFTKGEITDQFWGYILNF